MQAYLRITALALTCAIAIPVLASVEDKKTERIEIIGPDAAARAVLSIVDQDQHFDLTNGRRAVINVVGDSLQLVYRHRRSLLKHDGQGSFVSGDGRVSLKFAMDASGEANRMAISAPANWF